MRRVLHAAVTAAVSFAAVLATAPPAFAGLPSDSCNGGIPLVNDFTEGVHTKLFWVPTTPITVCFRVEQVPSGPGAGGVITIDTTVPPEPTPIIQAATVDAQTGQCGQPGNTVPGSHPVSIGYVLGQFYRVDAWSDSTSYVNVCVDVVPNAIRLGIPIPTLSGTYTVPTPVTVTLDP